MRALGSDQLYQSLSMVFQQVQLHQGSIRDNIALSTAPVSDEAVQQACRDAWCDDFICRLPAGYETQIGEGGMRLSGGERQRLSIARTLLKDAPVLLLDEATASVDPISQAEIQLALSRLVQGRTVVMIAHRLSTITHADQILVLDQGRIVGQGTHLALLSNCPLYQRLWHAQHSQAPIE
nr:ABC transporter ATP-binding protein [Aquaspirillum sp. LM1]